ncbi:MAG TPA: serine hydrolase domain-containing protein [Sphingomonadaceae bacterium]|nr:serine hydrolase domain-containing protein [Sphingomonadaceae bacterium]
MKRNAITRRSLIRAGAALGASAAIPLFGGRTMAQAGQSFPNVAKMCRDYVNRDMVANMIAYIGVSGAAAQLVGSGRDSFNGSRRSDADSIYRIYSMTKPITGMAAMMLVEEGKLTLDTELPEILPKFDHMMVQKEYDGAITPDNLEPAERPITIRQLLTHTAGLGYSAVQQGPIREAMNRAGVVSGMLTRLPIEELLRGAPVHGLELFADRLAEFPLVWQPGKRWIYSTGLDLMGRVIEVVSGQRFDAFLKERIFDPCGMEETWFQVPQSEVHRLTTSYGVIGGFVIPIDFPGFSIFLDKPPFPMGGSGLASTPRDYDRFLRMLAGYGMLEGKRVMSAAAVRTGTSNLLPDLAVTNGTSVAGYGFGAGGRVGWAGAPQAYGWAGAAGTIGVVDMASGSRAGLYTQYMPVFTYPVYEDFEEALAKDLALQQG